MARHAFGHVQRIAGGLLSASGLGRRLRRKLHPVGLGGLAHLGAGCAVVLATFLTHLEPHRHQDQRHQDSGNNQNHEPSGVVGAVGRSGCRRRPGWWCRWVRGARARRRRHCRRRSSHRPGACVGHGEGVASRHSVGRSRRLDRSDLRGREKRTEEDGVLSPRPLGGRTRELGPGRVGGRERDAIASVDSVEPSHQGHQTVPREATFFVRRHAAQRLRRRHWHLQLGLLLRA
mmetsp:Transcript_12630/g.32293  ORF Transcript_12630/g.32293 Transcript_12630/m.32293 type:complete len:232 (-) Transcript_12630:1045-1740(-)